MAPSIRFCKAPAARIAYAIDGEGPPVLLPAWWVSHVERDWEEPDLRAFMSTLARAHTVVRYDRAGCGLSDRRREQFTFAEELETFEVLAEHLGFPRVALLGLSCGGPIAVTYAARHPERVSRLALYGTFASGPRIAPDAMKQALAGLVRAHWGVGARTLTDVFAPDATAEQARRLTDQMRVSADTETAACLLELTYRMDVTAEAEKVRVPTLVLHPRGDRAIAVDHGRDVASRIPGASFITVEGRNHLPWFGDRDAILTPLLAFLGGGAPSAVGDGALELRRDGEVWTLRFAGRTCHLKHTRGLADLAVLLERPGEEVHVLELAGGPEPTARLGADAVLDEKARASYRRRAAELEADLELARRDGDLARLERLGAEREALLDELRVATGLGGRPRALNDAGERARKAITARLREAIARIRDAHPSCGEHLESAVRTGTFCAYQPQPRPA